MEKNVAFVAMIVSILPSYFAFSYLFYGLLKGVKKLERALETVLSTPLLICIKAILYTLGIFAVTILTLVVYISLVWLQYTFADIVGIMYLIIFAIFMMAFVYVVAENEASRRL